ncbi:MAG: Dicer-like protein 2 [Peltula sp. TS41687]|nr:MAG: Dicer-like protein 2 [Peltula sp. TS41687]
MAQYSDDEESMESIDVQQHDDESLRDGVHLGQSQPVVTDSSGQEDKPSQMEESRKPILRPRAYQLEMLEKSLEGNIIVAMDTGSVKHLQMHSGGSKQHSNIISELVANLAAILLTAPENIQTMGGGDVDRSHELFNQLVWFLAPSVALTEQQYTQLSSQLPTTRLRFLSGADNVDRWSEQRIWDAVLKDIQVVVSTHKVLLDALTHGFVRMTDISLLVFDEANMIMHDFYHPIFRKQLQNAQTHRHISDDAQQCDTLPHILGLTASPVINSKPGGLNVIEKNLNALSKTPKIHREEFLSYVHPPELRRVEFSEMIKPPVPTLLRRLFATLELDVREDPYVMELSTRQDDRSRQMLGEILSSRRTYCQEHLKNLCNKALNIYMELGPWAVVYYISTSIEILRGGVQANDEQLSALNRPEQAYLLKVLEQVLQQATSLELLSLDNIEVSLKVGVLLDLLVSEDKPSFSGLVFVQQRATVAVLSELISLHPQTKNKFRCGTFVGTGTYSGRKQGIAELLSPRNQTKALDELRNGDKNLIITTSILEEGIDVSACNIVICFDKPQSLKSFIQRRGRARKAQSKYVIMIEENDHFAKARNWDALEAEMKEAYMDDMRQLQEDVELDIPDGSLDPWSFRIQKTGALLTAENAVQHLYHFCSVLPADPYVDLRPEFTITEEAGGFSANVILPMAVPVTLRRASSRCARRSKNAAKMDAAIRAYKALYAAGLVNDNLLPLFTHDKEEQLQQAVEKRPSMANVPALFNPWVEVATLWTDTDSAWHVLITLESNGNPLISMLLLLPVPPPLFQKFNLFWNEDTVLQVSTGVPFVQSFDKDFAYYSGATHLLLQSVFSSRLKGEDKDFVVYFAPPTDSVARSSALDSLRGSRPALDAMPSVAKQGIQHGIVRHVTQNHTRYVFQGWIMRPPLSSYPGSEEEITEPTSVLHLELTRLTKRLNFLHPIQKKSGSSMSNKSKSVRNIPAIECEIDNLPFTYSQFALSIPSIIHRYEIYLVAEHLRNTILGPLKFQDLQLVLTAISASSAQQDTNYQRLEFLGDTILKMCTSVQLLGEHMNWHEGYLSAGKDRAVANSRLARAAIESGLAAYILTRPFTVIKWRPMYRSDLLKPYKKSERQMSTKVLADVVEALIGAAFVEGGFDKALACINIFLPELPWLPLATRHTTLYEAVPPNVGLPKYFNQLESLIGYEFNKKALLIEAMTHPSYKSDWLTVSYQRLEFLGDAILDNIVVSALYKAPRELAHYDMHSMREAVVNASFLAFLCMGFSTQYSRTEIKEDLTTGTFHADSNQIVTLRLWEFMRRSSPEIIQAQSACFKRYECLRDSIEHALHETVYPWTQLIRLQADKFFSDLIESILGAIYVDSQGDLSACQTFLEKLGVLPYLRRIITNEVELLHPKERLGRLAGNERVEYVLSLDTTTSAHDTADRRQQQQQQKEVEVERQKNDHNSKKKYRCSVRVGEREVVAVGGGVSKEEVMTRAADVACRILSSKEEQPFSPCATASGGGGGGGGGGEEEEEEEEEMKRKMEC